MRGLPMSQQCLPVSARGQRKAIPRIVDFTEDAGHDFSRELWETAQGQALHFRDQ
jgi:hypothetical protein